MFVIEKHGVHIYVGRNLAMERLRKKWKGQYEDSAVQLRAVSTKKLRRVVGRNKSRVDMRTLPAKINHSLLNKSCESFLHKDDIKELPEQEKTTVF